MPYEDHGGYYKAHIFITFVASLPWVRRTILDRTLTKQDDI